MVGTVLCSSHCVFFQHFLTVYLVSALGISHLMAGGTGHYNSLPLSGFVSDNHIAMACTKNGTHGTVNIYMFVSYLSYLIAIIVER